ncbi:MAG: hypothetical protein M1840_004093 [Geoglossum simile]|nr:MAG: hypothetical protein M1840_004093 [Geoglossum simile]
MPAMKSQGSPPAKDNQNARSGFSDDLNQLLEHYLILLDQYQSLQTKLSKLLSSGYISLAEANFKSAGKIRYGQDFYDERMQATKNVTAPSENHYLIPSFELAEPSLKTPNSDSMTNTPPESASPPSKAKRLPSDPLHWFGILVPPALRTAQREFTGAVVDIVPQLVEVIAEMDLYERRIKEARNDGKHGES